MARPRQPGNPARPNEFFFPPPRACASATIWWTGVRPFRENWCIERNKQAGDETVRHPQSFVNKDLFKEDDNKVRRKGDIRCLHLVYDKQRRQKASAFGPT